MADESRRVRRFPSHGDSAGELPDPGDDPELHALLQQWRAPAPPDALDIRLLESSREHGARRWRLGRHVRALFSMAAMLGIAIAAWWIASELQGPRVSAAEVLAAATTTEHAWLARPDRVVHRTLKVQERRLPENVVVSTRRVDVWQHGERGLTVRRAYDSGHHIVGGEWIDRFDTRTLYRPKTQPVSSSLDALAMIAEPDQAWRVELSASTFAAVARPEKTRVSRSGSRVTLLWDSDASVGLTRAELTLMGDELHPISQTLTIRDQRFGSRQYLFEEVGCVEIPSGASTAAWFEPEADLLPPVSSRAAASAAAISVARKAAANAALDAIEFDVWYRAHLLNLTFERDVHVSRTDAGQVRMHISVANEFHRAVLASRLGELGEHPSIALSFSDIPPSSPTSAGHESRVPLFVVLREQFATTMSDEAALTAARVTLGSIRTTLDSHRARAAALRAFVARWPLTSLDRARKDDVAHWSTIVRDHALALGDSAQQIRESVSTMMPAPAGSSSESAAPPVPILNVKDATAAIALALSTSDALGAALSGAVTDADPPGDRVDLDRLVQVLRRMEDAARPFASSWYFTLD